MFWKTSKDAGATFSTSLTKGIVTSVPAFVFPKTRLNIKSFLELPGGPKYTKPGASLPAGFLSFILKLPSVIVGSILLSTISNMSVKGIPSGFESITIPSSSIVIILSSWAKTHVLSAIGSIGVPSNLTGLNSSVI